MRILQLLYSIWVIIWFVIIIVCSFPLVLIILCFNEKKRVLYMHHYLRGVAFIWFFVSGIRPKIYNKHLLPEDEGCVIVSNHASYLDAAVVYTAVDKVFKSLGKIEVAKAPLFGIIYQTVVVCLDRSNNMARARSMIKMAEMINQGLDIVIFPEGTFGDITQELLPFHTGAFRLAIDSKKSLLPLLLLDTAKRMHPLSIVRFSPGLCRSVFLPAVSVAAINKHDDKQLKQYMYNYMNAMFVHCNKHGVENIEAVATQWLANNQFQSVNTEVQS